MDPGATPAAHPDVYSLSAFTDGRQIGATLDRNGQHERQRLIAFSSVRASLGQASRR